MLPEKLFGLRKNACTLLPCIVLMYSSEQGRRIFADTRGSIAEWRSTRVCAGRRSSFGRCLRGRRYCRRIDPLPFPRQQLVKARDGQIGDAGQHVGKPGLRIDIVETGRGDEGQHDGRLRPATGLPATRLLTNCLHRALIQLSSAAHQARRWGWFRDEKRPDAEPCPA